MSIQQIRKSKRFYISVILAVIWMGIIFSFSNKTGTQSTKQSSFIAELFEDFLHVEFEQDVYDIITLVIRKLAHFFEYAVLGVLYMGINYEIIAKNRIRISATVLMCMIYAISDEIHQGFVGGRSPQILDVCIDTLGGFAGAAVSLIVILHAKKYKERRKKNDS